MIHSQENGPYMDSLLNLVNVTTLIDAHASMNQSITQSTRGRNRGRLLGMSCRLRKANILNTWQREGSCCRSYICAHVHMQTGMLHPHGYVPSPTLESTKNPLGLSPAKTHHVLP